MRSFHKVLIAGIAVLAAGCQTVQTTQPGAIGVERKQHMLVSEADVEKGAQVAYQQELDKAKQKGALNADKNTYDRVQTISRRLIPQTTVFRPDAADWKWEVNVQTTDDVNAYCMPGGKIMVYTGLIEQLHATDAELAAVIGHEIAHALREHSRERLSRAYAQQLALTGIALATGAGDMTMELANQVAAVTFTLPHSREQEAEADRVGLELMARAGYDPNASITLWQKMGKLGGSKSEFFSTHPSSDSRIKDLQANVPKVAGLYEAARR
ncbi:putative Zn-dependent protease [Povalibacter uvarum]|uniref:Putative Zn-dependent protease n=1 Tax=Povalibacter uvarum TaxID=732238 RepID=A0A841HNW2_9GAMM|nr:M48 family metallopeptidase [Povalibacter uvarum]MBB6094566.1 putative Zn-dependent protease [Povalibacter uvarum]